MSFGRLLSAYLTTALSIMEIQEILPPRSANGIRFSAQHIFPGLEVPMVAKYDIFKKINESLVWVEAVEDIVTETSD